MRPDNFGAGSFSDYRFWLAAACYIVSLPFFFEGVGSWAHFQVVMPSCIAFIIVTTIAWDYRIIGNPNHLPSLILHALFMVSLVFFLNRLMAGHAVQPHQSGLAGLGAAIMEATTRLPYLSNLYAVFAYVLRWLGFAIMLFFISGALLFSQRIAVALLFVQAVIAVALSLGAVGGPTAWHLLAGIVLSAVAFRLQLADERKTRFWTSVANTLSRSGPRPPIDVELKVALLEALDNANELSERQFRAVVAGRLECGTDDSRVNPICIRIADQMVNQDGLAESRDGERGWRFVLNLPEEAPDFFTVTARVVRVIVTVGFCTVYILSPIDLIPDATPVFGVVDDMLLGAIGLLSTVKTLYGGNHHSGRVGRIPFRNR